MKIAPLVFAVVVFSASPASAFDWFVNSPNDRVDSRPGDRACDTGFMTPAGEPECTLRAAIQEANSRTALRRTDRIHLPAGELFLTLAAAPGEDEDLNQLTSTWDMARASRVGDLDIDADVAIVGTGATTVINGGAIDRVFDVWGLGGGIGVTIDGVIIRLGFSRNQGGCIHNRSSSLVSLSNVIVQDCVADHQVGGGLYNNGHLIVYRSLFRNNSAGRGGAIENSGQALIDESAFYLNSTVPLAHEPSSGGAISNMTVHGEAPYLRVTNSTFSGNTVTGVGGRGGAIFNRGAADIGNSTVSGNRAEFGGGIGLGPSQTPAGIGHESTLIASSTIVRNLGGGTWRNTDLPLHVRHSIVALNPNFAGTPSNCVGFVTDSDHSIEDALSCAFAGVGDMTMTDPLIGPLADNGGPTQTHALLPGSPAIDAVSPPWARRDQRGYPRPIFAAGDIGAYEKGFDLFLLVDVPWSVAFAGIFTKTTTSFHMDLSLKLPGAAGSDLIEPRIIGVKGANGPVQFKLAEDGKSIRIDGLFTPPKDQSNLTLFRLEVQQGFKTPALLQIDNVSCDCEARPRKNPPPIVIPAAQKQ